MAYLYKCEFCGAPSVKPCESDAQSKETCLNRWHQDFLRSQKPLGKEFEGPLFDNLWDLYAR